MTTDSNPFRSLERQFERMQRQFEEALDVWNGGQTEMPEMTVSTMGIDLADHGDQFVLTADVPGFEKDEIDLRLSDRTIHITAEREHETTEEREEEYYLKSERARESMSRAVRIPEPVEEDAVAATYKNGVLTITLPKRDPADPNGQQIDIE